MSLLMRIHENDSFDRAWSPRNNEIVVTDDVHLHNYDIPYISPKRRKIVLRIVYFIFVLSSVCILVRLCLGWNCLVVHQILMTVCITVAFVQLPLGKAISIFVPKKKASKWQVLMFSLIPWRSLSRSWGRIAAIPLPVLARPLIFGTYSFLFSVNTQEMEKPFSHYTCITDFFTRKLKTDARVVDHCGVMVSPCDGTIVECGPISDPYIRKVKGIDYCIKSFLGFKPGKGPASTNSIYNQRNCLYQCVLYLAPGDYHRFHSPCDWVVHHRRHYRGKLLSVSPKMARWMPNLLAINERVVYVGKWEHGFFSYTAVGATNVGSINFHNDPTLTTNSFKSNHVNYKRFEKKYKLFRGEEMGFFSMGSTIVLIFEAPENFHFTCRESNFIKYGNCLGGLDFTSSISQPSLASLVTDEVSDADWDDYHVDNELYGSEEVRIS